MKGTVRRPGGDKFPCASLAEALPHLRRPHSAAAVQFKIQNAVEEAAQVAAYIDARHAFDRLDHVRGHRWSARFDELPKELTPPPVDRRGALKEPPPLYVRCRLTLLGRHARGRRAIGRRAPPLEAAARGCGRAG